MTKLNPDYARVEFENASRDVEWLRNARAICDIQRQRMVLTAEIANTDIGKNALREAAAQISDNVLPVLDAEMNNLEQEYGVSRHGACDPRDVS